MAIVTTTSAKANFQTGDKPTQAQFVDLIDTLGQNAVVNAITEKGMVANVSADNAAAFGAAWSAAAANGRPLFLPDGTYDFLTAPAAITQGVTILGSLNVRMRRRYTPASADSGFIRVLASQARIDGMSIVAAGTGGGKGLEIVATSAADPIDGSATPDWGIHKNIRIQGSGEPWKYPLYIDGSARADSLSGVRDLHLENILLFDASADSAYINNVVNLTWVGGGVFQGSFGDAAVVRITGADGDESQRVSIANLNLSGSLNVDNTDQLTFSGVIDTNVTLGSGASNVYIDAAGSYSITNAASAVVVRKPNDATTFHGRQDVTEEVSGNHTFNWKANGGTVFTVSPPSSRPDAYIALQAAASANTGVAIRVDGTANGNKDLQIVPGSAGAVNIVGGTGLEVSGAVRITNQGIFNFPQYTVGTLPTATTGFAILVTDASAAGPAYAQGGVWRSFRDGNQVD